jgi:heterodisulfide reductase subunit C
VEKTGASTLAFLALGRTTSNIALMPRPRLLDGLQCPVCAHFCSREVNLSKVYIVLLGFSSHEGVRGPLADHPRRTAAD